MCSAPPTDPANDPVNHLRGPVWPQLNWLAAEGLDAVGLAGDAASLRRSALAPVAESGFSEHVDSRDGAPGGASHFGWTAAIALDLLERGVSLSRTP